MNVCEEYNKTGSKCILKAKILRTDGKNVCQRHSKIKQKLTLGYLKEQIELQTKYIKLLEARINNMELKLKDISSGSEMKEDISSGSEIKDISSGSETKEDISSGSETKEDISSGSETKEDISSGSEIKDISSGSEIKDISSGSETKEDISSGSETKEDKQKIIDLFMNNVKGKEIILTNKHCGSEGHWLETQMGIIHNSKNEPDINGYELKKNSSKITLGDFSASEYLFSKNRDQIETINNWNKNTNIISREQFIRYFGNCNQLKNNRYSWSGSCVPKYGIWNEYGQIIQFNDQFDLCIMYSFERDTRECKYTYPLFLQKNNITIAFWNCEKLKSHINNKFNKKGFFICKKDGNVYDKISFGKPFDFNYFVDGVKNRIIIFDSGMFEGNSRNYSQFRSSAKNFWNILITEEY